MIEWRNKNKEKYNSIMRKAQKKQRQTNKIKIYARIYDKNQRQDKCLYCGYMKNLHFHHTNYEKREGFTLCRTCHLKEHNKISRI